MERFLDPTGTRIKNAFSDRLVTSSRAWLEVRDVMSTNVTTISSDQTIVSAAEIMAQSKISCIVALDDTRLAGILTETDFLRRIAENDEHLDGRKVVEIMSSPVKSVASDLSILEAARILEKEHIKRLPVLKDGRLAGIVTQTDLVRILTTYGLWRDVTEIMSKDVACVNAAATVAEAARVMTSRNVSCVVVFDQDQAVGIFTERDLLGKVVARHNDPTHTTMKDVMSSPVVSIPSGHSVFSASRAMESSNLRRLAVIDEDKRLCGIVAQTDVFKAVKRKLQEEEDENFRLLEQSQSSIFTTDPEGNTTYVNPAFLKLFDVSDPAEFIGQSSLPERFWLNPKQRARVLGELKSGTVEINELALRTAKGENLYATLFCTFTRDVRGEIDGSQGILYDVTEKKELVALRKAEKALWKSREWYRSLIESTSDWIWEIDANSVFTYVSPQVKSLLGYEADEVIGKTPFDLMLPEEAPRLARFYRDTTDAGRRICGLEGTYLHKDGSPVVIETNGVPVLDANGTPLGYRGINRDVTQRRQAEEALRSANKALEEFSAAAEAASRAKSEFLANMNHEIRTPMTAILGFVEILRSDGGASQLPAEHLETIETITRNGQHLLKLIDGILDLSKIEADKLKIVRETCSPRQIVSGVVALMKRPAAENDLDLTVEFDGKIPESIQTDPARLHQILINLVGNAVKFTQAGGVRLVVRLLDEHAGGPRIEFQVVDTGIGLTQEQISHLFEPFSQADSSATREFGGAGLGLAISKRLAETLGGDIRITSAPGLGSTFALTIETGSLEGVKLQDHPKQAESPSGQADTPATSQNVRLECRVLVVEDGPDNQRIISVLLKKAGAQVTLAENGQLAIDRVHDARQNGRPFHVILMDMQMPVLDGYDATRKLRAEGYDAPIVALTAHAMKGDDQECLDAGCDAYMTKPIDRGELLSVVARYAGPKPAEVTANRDAGSREPSPQ